MRPRGITDPSFQQPLLEVFEDEYMVQRHGRRSRRHRRHNIDLIQPGVASLYQPPQPPIVSGRIVAPGGHYVHSSTRMASPHRQYIHRSVAIRNNENPITDETTGLLDNGCCCFQCVRTQELGITEDCGAFQAIRGPGMYPMFWPYTTIAAILSLRLQQLDVICETKTKDNGT